MSSELPSSSLCHGLLRVYIFSDGGTERIYATCLLCSTFIEPHLVEVPADARKLVNQRHTFRCGARGDVPLRVTWWHDKKELHRHGKGYRVLRSGNLRLLRLRPDDSGLYRCVVRNQHGSVQSPLANLTVEGMSLLTFSS